MATKYVTRITVGKTKPQTELDVPKRNLTYDEFKKIDEHARQAPRSVEKSIETLAKYLAKPAQNDLEVVRGLYVWVCENISYDTKAYFSGNYSTLDSSGDGVLKSKSSVCEGYANLFLSLCQAVGITCKKISGYAKGKSIKLGDTITYNTTTNHAWNIVKLNGVWCFIETTWGAGHLGDSQNFVKSFENFYFLTTPELFIYRHFPFMHNRVEESKRLQLLENPISIEEFSKSIAPSSEACQYGVKFSSHPYKTIIVNNCSCTIIVEATSKYPFKKCSFNFYDNRGQKCNEGAIMVFENNKSFETTVRPPNTGKYMLNLYTSFKKKDSPQSLVDYIIDCKVVEPNWKPYPNNLGYYGPVPDFNDRGFERLDIQTFNICKDGNFHLFLKTPPTLDVLVELHDAKNVDNTGYILVDQNDLSVNIRSRLLNKGYYELTLFSKVDQSYTLAYTVLILNTGESDVKSKFPITYTTTTQYKCQLFQPLVRDLSPNSTVCFEFISAAFDSILVDGKEFACTNGDKWKVTVTTGETRKLKLSGHPKGSTSSLYYPIYEFVIKSKYSL